MWPRRQAGSPFLSRLLTPPSQVDARRSENRRGAPGAGGLRGLAWLPLVDPTEKVEEFSPVFPVLRANHSSATPDTHIHGVELNGVNHCTAPA